MTDYDKALTPGDLYELPGGNFEIAWEDTLGRPGAPMRRGHILLERNPLLTPPQARGCGGDPGEYWRLAQMPHVRSFLERPIRALAATPWRLEAPEIPEGKEGLQDVADRQYALCKAVWDRWQEIPGAWGRFIREAVFVSAVCGFSLFELVGETIDVSGEDVLAFKLPELRFPWTVRYWLTQGGAELVGVVLGYGHTSDYEGDTPPYEVVLPADKFIHVSERLGDNWEGESWLRSIYNILKLMQDIYQLVALGLEVGALGELWFVNSDGTAAINADDQDALQDYVDLRKADGAPGGVCPPGWTPIRLDPGSSVIDPTPYLAVLEKAVALALAGDDQLIALGGAGSYAARDVASADNRAGFQYILHTFVRNPVMEVFRRLILTNFPDAPCVFLPTLTFGQVAERDTSEWLRDVREAKEAGLLDDPELGPLLRDELGLPALEPQADDVVEPAGLDPQQTITAARLGGLLDTVESRAWARALLGMPPMTPGEVEAVKRQLGLAPPDPGPGRAGVNGGNTDEVTHPGGQHTGPAE